MHPDLAKLHDSLLIAPTNGPVIGKRGLLLRGITREIHRRFYVSSGIAKRRKDRSSLVIGNRVHRELRQICENGSVMNPHPWTLNALFTLARSRLHMVASEVPVSWQSLGTRIDLIAQPNFRDKDLILVSVKTGKRRPSKRNSVFLPAPLDFLRASDQTMDDVQVAAELGLARKGHDVVFARAVILEVPEGRLREASQWTSEVTWQDKLLNELNLADKKKDDTSFSG